MILRIFVLFALLFTGANASAYMCSTVSAYSNPCPTSRSALSERYKSISGVCGNGSAVTYNTSGSCMGKRQLESLLDYQCRRNRACNIRVPTPIVKPVYPAPDYPGPSQPKPISYPDPLPRPVVDPPIKPLPVEPLPVILPPPSTSNPPPPQPPVSGPVPGDSGAGGGGAGNLPPIMLPDPSPIQPVEPPRPPPLIAQPPPPSAPPPVVVQPPPPVVQPPPSTGAPITTKFEAQYASAKTDLNNVSVSWTSSSIIGNYCGTGSSYIHYAKLDKTIPENAAFFAAYPTASRQSMSVTLVCRAPRQETFAMVENMYAGPVKTVYYNYPDGCYVVSATAVPAPPRCMIP